MRYLIDTDWVIYHFRGLERVTHKLEELAPFGLALSIVSSAELYEGVYRSKNHYRDEQSLRRFVSSTNVLGINEEISKVFGRKGESEATSKRDSHWRP